MSCSLLFLQWNWIVKSPLMSGTLACILISQLKYQGQKPNVMQNTSQVKISITWLQNAVNQQGVTPHDTNHIMSLYESPSILWTVIPIWPKTKDNFSGRLILWWCTIWNIQSPKPQLLIQFSILSIKSMQHCLS